MTNAEFKNIFDNGYKVNYTQGTSEIRCPICGNESYLSTNDSETVTCINNHNYAVIDFTVEWTKIRDDMLKTFLDHQQEQSCNI